MVAFAMYSAPVMAPVAAPELGVPASAVGYFVALAYVGSMIGSASAGGWVARAGPIRVSQVGLALCLAGLALAASGRLPLVLAGAFLVGLGYGPSTPASSAILARAAPPGAFSLVFSIKQTGVPAGGVLAGALVPLLVLALGWRWSAVVVGASCLALALAVAPVRARYDVGLNPRAPVSLAAAFQPLRLVARLPALREMAVISFIYGGVQIMLVTYLVSFLVESFSLALVFAGGVMAVSQVASVAGRIAWGALADRGLGQRRVLGLLGLGMGACALATLAASPAWPQWLLFAFAAAFGATAVGWNGVFLAQVARVAPPGQVSAATGACLAVTFLGVVLTPLVFNALLALGASYALAYALLGLPALAIGARLALKGGA
ncbi:MAG: MFS transporter [Burkholderiales bacterium]